MAGSLRDASVGRPTSSIGSPRLSRSRTQSISSDRPSTIGHNLLSPPLSVSPEAAFIASSAASQIITNDHDSHADVWYDEAGMVPAGETALISQAALQLVNNFLDQLLFSFLQVSKATTLSALRPAVSEVLKPKLAKDAINNADEELREYLGGGDEDDYIQPQSGEPGRDWDVELVWKRTRLRCMVYSSLGDMEEEDEDLYMEQENLEIGADEQISDVISPAVAIFLTSVLEYMGELTLTVAGQAAFQRMRASFEKELKEGTKNVADVADRIVVEEGDMERVALDRTLGRLWRGWKKRIRSPGIMEVGRSFSRGSIGHLRTSSNFGETLASRLAGNESTSDIKEYPVAEEPPTDSTAAEESPETKGRLAVLHREASEVPLPLGDNDVNEIEIPGLALYNNIADEENEVSLLPIRPQSLFLGPSILDGQAIAKPPTKRRRSASLPLSRKPQFSGQDTQEAPPADSIASGEREKDVFEEAMTEQPHEENEPTEIGIARTTDERASSYEADTTDDIGAYEKAEILTSARVSVASSSPSLSEGGLKKSNSVRSPRIVDVAARRASQGSRSPSMDTFEKLPERSTSLNRASQSSTPSNAEETRRPLAADNVVRITPANAGLRVSVDRVRPSLRNSATISESEEETNERSVKRPTEGTKINFVSSPRDVTEDTISPRNQHAPTPQQSTQKQSSPDDQYATPTSAAPVLSANLNGRFVDETIPELPIRAPARMSAERTRNRDSEDAPSFPIQSNVPPRQTHTSGSSTSSATSRLKPVRTSEEYVPTKADNMARNFEELIHSNQTITYTLTPENMRDMDSPRSVDTPVMQRFPRGGKAEDNNRVQDRSRSSSNATEAKAASVNRMVAVPSHPYPESNAPSIKTSGQPQPSSSSVRSSLRSSPAGPKVSRGPAPQARDARIPADSTADFAEFIKSTGPPGDNRPAPLRNSNVTSSPVKTSIDSRRVSSASSRNRYQARDATVESKGDNSDLIDFIRQGPPSAGANPRIPRHVAPFRNTMDSEHTSGASGGRAVDATIPEVRNSQASTNFTEGSMPSMQSSVNSSSALLKNTGQAMPNNRMFDDDDMMPQRKQRRVRDPYAIDFSDEDDDDELLMTPKPPAKKEESLAEFLRNYEPPPEPIAPPVSQQIPKKKASAPSLMGRFTRHGFSRESKDLNGSNGKQASEGRSLSSRMGSSAGNKNGHVPLQVSMPPGYDKYGRADSNPSRPRGMSSGGPTGPTGRVPMKKFEPRDATPIGGRTGTSDLAAFLRDSEPPPGALAAPVQPQANEEERGFSRMFRRQKKSAV